MNDFEGMTEADFVQLGGSVMDERSAAIRSLKRQRKGYPRSLKAQLERAAFMGAFTYGGADLSSDANVIKFMLDRLERVEQAQSAAYETIRCIDWAI